MKNKNQKKAEIGTLIAELEEKTGLAVDRYGEFGLVVDANRVYRFSDEAEFLDALYCAVEAPSICAAFDVLEQFEI